MVQVRGYGLALRGLVPVGVLTAWRCGIPWPVNSSGGLAEQKGVGGGLLGCTVWLMTSGCDKAHPSTMWLSLQGGQPTGG